MRASPIGCARTPRRSGDVSVTIDNTSETVGELTGSATVSPEQVQQLMDGLWYVNVHTELNGPGEIRGQLIQQ